LAHKKNIELVASLHPSVPRRLQGDPTRLQQVVSNLVNNAVKFAEHGEVVLRVTLDEESGERAVIRFTISDTGIGIPPERQADLFQSFRQVDSSTTRQFGGTGLGLAICKQIVDLMGGAIGVESTPGEGSTFWFVVPFETQTATGQPTTRDWSDLRRSHILVVDDNATNREIIKEQLEILGMSVELAGGAREALRRLKAAARSGHRFDMALIDRHMPEMDGLELGRHITAHNEIQDTVLVLLSSSGDQDSESFKRAGFSGWLTKPIWVSELLQNIAESYACAASGPRESRATATPPATKSDAGATTAPLQAHVLLVEDNEIGQIAGREVLLRLGCTCDTADNGQQAIDAVSRRPYDVVLMDCQMPVVDGFEATQRIRALEQQGALPKLTNSRLPIVALTANALAGDRQRCLDCGMDDYISKPMEPDVLAAVIRNQIQATQPRGSEASHSPREIDSPASGSPATSAPTSTPERPAIDFETLKKRWGNDEAFAVALVGRFRVRAATLLDRLKGQVQAGMPEEAEQVAHNLQSAAHYVAADRVSSCAGEVEACCRAADLAAAADLLPRLEHEIQQCAKSCSESERAQHV